MNGFSTLDVVDLALYDAIKSFILSDKCETIIINHQVYYWVSPTHLIEEMPILGINTTRGINVRIDKLIGAELLERCPQNQSTRKTYVKMGRKYNLYECHSTNENEISELGKTIPSVTTNNFSKDNNTNIDNINNIQEKKDKEKNTLANNGENPNPPIPLVPPSPLKFPYNSAEFMEWWNKVLSLKKWKNKDAGQLQFSLNKLAKVSEQDAIKAMQETYESGWQGVFPKVTAIKPNQSAPQSTAKKPIWEELGMTYEQYKSQF